MTAALEQWRFPNQATPLGSSAYYSLRFSPKESRDDLATLLAWRHQLRAVLGRVSDPNVARLKLHWWREELGRGFNGTPSHPLAKALQSILVHHALPQSAFLDMTDAVEAELLNRHPATETDLDGRCAQDLGALFELLARLHGHQDGNSLATARRLGGLCALVYLIRDSGALARAGRAPIPDEQLHAQGLSRQALTRREQRRLLPRLLQPAALRAKAGLARTDGISAMPVAIRSRLRILQALLEELEAENLDVAEQRIGLTPVRKLWLAWRSNRLY